MKLNNIFTRAMPAAVGGFLVIAGTVLLGEGTRFSDFTPLTSSAGPTADEAMPITLSNPLFQQRSIADRDTQIADGKPNSGSWDMNTVNETGPHEGRFLFTVFESDQSGVQRHDLLTGVTDTIWYSPVLEASQAIRSVVLDALGNIHYRRGGVVHGGGGMHHQHLGPAARAHQSD